MCGIEAARRGRRVIILEKNSAPAQKVLVSGGGNCNATNSLIDPERYACTNPRFVLSALSRFDYYSMLDFMSAHRVRYTEKENGKLFCTDGATALVTALLNQCKKHSVSLFTDQPVDGISIDDDMFT
ncbi:MAG: aminoacetone oxidase family FAD-binding enzyme, partial [Chitinivibrionales bacterium]|nr:aminoacetone oxidase family FAD-binding enzyme [Chitinivibrionales bacterium]